MKSSRISSTNTTTATEDSESYTNNASSSCNEKEAQNTTTMTSNQETSDASSPSSSSSLTSTSTIQHKKQQQHQQKTPVSLTPSSNSKVRYFINSSTNSKSNTLMSSNQNVSSLQPAYYYDPTYNMYRTFSYVSSPMYQPQNSYIAASPQPYPYMSNRTTPVYFQQQQPQQPQHHQLDSIISRTQPSIPQIQSQTKAPEYVSIRYFAPVEHVNATLAKGEALNTLRRQLPMSVQSVQFAPHSGSHATDEKRYFSTISSTNCYVSDGKINTATFQRFYEPNKSSQQQLLLSTPNHKAAVADSLSSSGSVKNENTPTKAGHLSSLWNLTDSSGTANNAANNTVTSNQRFYKEIQSENSLLNKFYDRQGSGGTLDKKSFSQKFGKTRKERVKRNCVILGTVFGLLAVVGVVASVILCTAFSNSNSLIFLNSSLKLYSP